MIEDPRSAVADRVSSTSSPRAMDVEVARLRAVAKLAAAHDYPHPSAPKTLAERIASLRAGARHPAARAAILAIVLIGLTLLGARIGPRKSANAASPPASATSAPAAIVSAFPVGDMPAPVASSSAAPTLPEPNSAPSGTLPDGRVVLNLANEDDLTKLPHIGPTRARAILALRQKLGKFHMVTDLLRVKGLGRKTLAKLAPKLLVDPPADSAAKG